LDLTTWHPGRGPGFEGSAFPGTAWRRRSPAGFCCAWRLIVRNAKLDDTEQ